jgi:hypothetical protein
MLDEMLKKIILKRVAYTGNNEKEVKQIGCSALTEDPLKLMFKYKYGSIPQTYIGQNTMGSLLDLGLRETFKTEGGFIDFGRMNYFLPNGWTLSGETDLVYLKDNILYIIDCKMTKDYTLKKIKSKKHNSYFTQLEAYKFLITQKLLKQNIDMNRITFKLYLMVFVKDGGIIKDYKKVTERKVPNYELIEIEDRGTDIPKIAINKINEIEMLLETSTNATKCEAFKCNYCDYKSICKFMGGNEPVDEDNNDVFHIEPQHPQIVDMIDGVNVYEDIYNG